MCAFNTDAHERVEEIPSMSSSGQKVSKGTSDQYDGMDSFDYEKDEIFVDACQ